MTEKPTKLELITPPSTPSDASDIESIWLDPGLGDGLAETIWQSIPLDKPKDFFRVHPSPNYRRRTEIYAHKVEGQVGTTYYIIGPKMQGRIAEARPCILVTCIYRDGSPRLWPIMFPREGEKDNTAWSTARIAARTAIDGWVKLVWIGGGYQTRPAQPGYSPDPDWTKLPPYDDLTRAAAGPHGIIRNTDHAIYRALMGAPELGDNDDI